MHKRIFHYKEIEKNPEMEENIKYISMKRSENENAAKVWLVKVKDMVLKQAIAQRRASEGRMTENLG